MKYIPTEKLIAEINALKERYGSCVAKNEVEKCYKSGRLIGYTDVLYKINKLQQDQPKFNVGDLVVSKKNPHLTYRILATNIPNELGKTNYKVEIFTDGKPDEPHNIHLISSDKIEDWGELVQQEQPDLPSGEEVMTMCNQILIDWVKEGKTPEEVESRKEAHSRFFELYDEYIMQEQPEVDLEKEIRRWFMEEYGNNTLGLPQLDMVTYIARHFYELGLNARKEG